MAEQRDTKVSEHKTDNTQDGKENPQAGKIESNLGGTEEIGKCLGYILSTNVCGVLLNFE